MVIRKAIYDFLISTGLDNFAASQPNQAFWSKMVPWNKDYDQKHTKTINRHGVNYLVRPYDYVQWRLFAQKDDLSTMACLDALPLDKSAPGIILDIGSNCGHFSLKLGRKLLDLGYSNKKIIAFEPNPVIYKCITDNLTLNPELSSIVKVEPLALSDKIGVSTLTVPEINSGAASLIPNTNFKNTVEVEITTDTLTNYLKNKLLPKVDFIKIDVEGMEEYVLAGAKEVLTKDHPDVYLEVNPLWEKSLSKEDSAFSLLRDRYEFWVERNPNSGKPTLEKFQVSKTTDNELYNLWARNKTAV